MVAGLDDEARQLKLRTCRLRENLVGQEPPQRSARFTFRTMAQVTPAISARIRADSATKPGRRDAPSTHTPSKRCVWKWTLSSQAECLV